MRTQTAQDEFRTEPNGAIADAIDDLISKGRSLYVSFM
jgi:hypothetical protein